jgi:hypothetical protein
MDGQADPPRGNTNDCVRRGRSARSKKHAIRATETTILLSQKLCFFLECIHTEHILHYD